MSNKKEIKNNKNKAWINSAPVIKTIVFEVKTGFLNFLALIFLKTFIDSRRYSKNKAKKTKKKPKFMFCHQEMPNNPNSNILINNNLLKISCFPLAV